MRLNLSAQMALNVFPVRSDEPAKNSLYGFLNRCCTPMGKRVLKVEPLLSSFFNRIYQTWIRQPLMDLDEITLRHDIVEAFTLDTAMQEDIRSVLRG